MIPGIRASSYALRQCWSDNKDDGAFDDSNDADKDDINKDFAEKVDLRNTSERLFSVLVAFSLAGLEDLVRSWTCFEYLSFLIFCFVFVVHNIII